MKRKKRDTAGRRIAQAIIAEYKPQSVAEMKAALKEVFVGLRTQLARRKRDYESA